MRRTTRWRVKRAKKLRLIKVKKIQLKKQKELELRALKTNRAERLKRFKTYMELYESSVQGGKTREWRQLVMNELNMSPKELTILIKKSQITSGKRYMRILYTRASPPAHIEISCETDIETLNGAALKEIFSRIIEKIGDSSFYNRNLNSFENYQIQYVKILHSGTNQIVYNNFNSAPYFIALKPKEMD